jgi:hypothetical protein
MGKVSIRAMDPMSSENARRYGVQVSSGKAGRFGAQVSSSRNRHKGILLRQRTMFSICSYAFIRSMPGDVKHEGMARDGIAV